MGILKKLAADAAIYGFSTIVARLINYLLVAYHTRVLGPEQYGVFTEFFGYITLLLVLLTYGMETGFFRFASRQDQSPNLVFSTSLVALFATSTVFLALVLSNVNAVAAWMGYPNHANYVGQLAAVIAMDAFVSIPFARLRLQRKAKKFAMFKLINVFFYVGLNILFFTGLPQYFVEHPNSALLQFFSPQADVGYVFIANLLASLLTLLMLLPTIFEIKIHISLPLLKKMLVYSLPLLVAGLPGIANDYIDRVLFKHLFANPDIVMQELGVYGANAKLAVLMVIFVQMFRYAAEPFFFSNANKKDSPTLLSNVMTYFVIAAMCVFLVVALYLDAFALLMGKSFRNGTDIVPIMLIANVFFGITFNLSMWYKISEKTKMAVYITLTGFIVTVAINVLFVPHFGYRAAAWAHFASNLAMVSISYFLGQKYYPVHYQLKKIGFYIIAGCALYGIFFALNSSFNLTAVPKFSIATILLITYLGLVLWQEWNILPKRLTSKMFHVKHF
ncbi:polysaccharide biosynthesis protein [Bacteroidia bacterium]|nr:polysaccharide biosynthesis protein [Bacteroidia bacterium]